jgi:hypothetical protein
MSAASYWNEKELRRRAVGDTSHYRVEISPNEKCYFVCRHCEKRVQAHQLDLHTKKQHEGEESLLMAEVPC